MKIEIEVKEWWIVDYQEQYQNYDQREGAYMSWKDAGKKFLSENEAIELINALKRERNSGIRNIILSHVREM